MIEDRPINQNENSILEIVQKYSKGDPYRTVSYNQIDNADWSKISDSIIKDIIEEYLNSSQIDYIRLRWLYRRLAQIGHPGAIDVTLNNIDNLTPCFASICTYITSLQGISKDKWEHIGSRLLELLGIQEIKESEYFRLSILSLFSRNSHINHFQSLAKTYDLSEASARREILLSAKASGAIDWLRELKESFDAMDHWSKMAFIYCLSDFPDLSLRSVGR